MEKVGYAIAFAIRIDGAEKLTETIAIEIETSISRTYDSTAFEALPAAVSFLKTNFYCWH